MLNILVLLVRLVSVRGAVGWVADPGIGGVGGCGVRGGVVECVWLGRGGLVLWDGEPEGRARGLTEWGKRGGRVDSIVVGGGAWSGKV